MKKILFLLLVLNVSHVFSQGYFNMKYTPESSPNACDGSIQLIPYQTMPPYTIYWWDSYDFNPSHGLRVENICNDIYINAEITDSSCRRYITNVYIGTDTSQYVILDTIIQVIPSTPTSTDGSIAFHFHHIPAGSTRSVSHPSSGGNTVDSVFTNLGRGYHGYSIHKDGYYNYEVNVPLFPAPVTPCGFFTTTPSCTVSGHGWSYTGDDPSFECIGSIYAPMDPYIANTERHYYTQGNEIPEEDYDDSLTNICRGAVEIDVNGVYNGNYHFLTISTIFVPDSNDIYYSWNEPNVITNTDTVLLCAISRCIIDYETPPDTVYISNVKQLSWNQWEITATIEQGINSYNVHTWAYLDTTRNYFFDFTVYCYNLMWEDPHIDDHFSNYIYYEFSDPDNRSSLQQNTSAKTTPLRMNAFPNPFSETLVVQATETMKRYEFFTLDGKCAAAGSINSIGYQFNTGTLDNGMYILKIYSASGETVTQQVIKM